MSRGALLEHLARSNKRSLLGAARRKGPGEARPFLGFPSGAAPRVFCSRRGESMGPLLKRWYGITLRADICGLRFTTCTVTSCPYRSMHALDELHERGRA